MDVSVILIALVVVITATVSRTFSYWTAKML